VARDILLTIIKALKTQQPNYQGVIDNIPGYVFPSDTNGELTIYDGIVIPSDYFALNHQGYIYPDVTGLYTFTSRNADDLTLFWIGTEAYSGWTRSNRDIYQAFGSGTNPCTFNAYRENIRRSSGY
jgi:hypothetical protein